METKQIKITTETKNRLDRIGRKGLTYNDIVADLLDMYDKKLLQLEATNNPTNRGEQDATN